MYSKLVSSSRKRQRVRSNVDSILGTFTFPLLSNRRQDIFSTENASGSELSSVEQAPIMTTPTADVTVQLTEATTPIAILELDISNEFYYSSDSQLYNATDNVAFPPSSQPEVCELQRLIDDLTSLVNRNPKVPKTFINHILQVLKKHSALNTLPSDYRTLLKTPRSYNVRDVHPGVYYNFGIEEGLKNQLESLPASVSVSYPIELFVNIDGLPLSKSSGSAVWPVLGQIRGLRNRPFMIGIYHGNKKPNCPNDFLKDFVEEAVHLQDNGFHFQNRHFQVKVAGIICDAPARAFITCTTSHSGKHGCPKCCVIGEWAGKTVFLGTNCARRTNSSFRLRSDPGYHKGTSILELLNLDMADGILLDYMHVACLGVMRKLLKFWVEGPSSIRLRPKAIQMISDRLESLGKMISSDFGRKPRGLQEISRWKATELRQFLLYTGPIVLRNILPTKLYQHFLVFHLAMRILISDDLNATFNDDANRLLRSFVLSARKVYGTAFMSFNVHCLLHLSEDAKNFGALDNFSAFPFENELQHIKKMVTKHDRPLAQIIRRTLESRKMPQFPKQMVQFTLSQSHTDGPLITVNLTCEQYRRIFCHLGKLSIQRPDNCIVSRDGEIVLIKNICQYGPDVHIIGSRLIWQNLFSKPWPSAPFGLYEATESSNQLESWPISVFTKKAMLLSWSWDGQTKFLVAELLHTGEFK